MKRSTTIIFVLFLFAIYFGCESQAMVGDEVDTTDTDGGDADADSDSDSDSDDDSDDDSDSDGDTDECNNTIIATVRDFKGYYDGHPDFETYAGYGATTGLIQDYLDSDFKPVFASSTGDGSNGIQITSQSSFNQWYRDVDGINISKEYNIELTSAGDYIWEYDSSAFFPFGPSEGFGAEDTTNYADNFHFTTEIHLEFEYLGGEVFNFRGDDDLWLFVDGQLVIDIGGLHEPVEQQLDIDSLGLTLEQTYRMSIFHAERHTYYSNFRIQTSIDCIIPIPPV